MGNKDKKRKKSVLENEHALKINSALDVVNNVITFGGFIGAAFIAVWNFLVKPENAHWLILLILIIVTIFLWLLLRVVRQKMPEIVAWVFRVFSKPAPYLLQRRDLTYEYVAKDEMRYKALYTVKALQTGVDHIRVRFNWSGSVGTEPLKPIPIRDEGCVTKRIEADGKEFGYAFYKVYAKTRINSDDEPIRLGVKMENMKDVGHKASPHFLTNINVQTDVLKMTVVLCAGIKPENIEFLEYLHAADDNHWRRYTKATPNTPVKIETGEDGATSIVWEKKKPILGGKYIIRWDPK